MNRLGYLVSLFMALSLLLAACAAPKAPALAPTPSPAPTAPAPSAPQLTQKQQWIEGAKKEGEVQFWTFTWEKDSPFEKRWKATYPSIKLTVWDASRATAAIEKQVEEAKVGRYSVDVVVYPTVDMTLAVTSGLLLDYDFPGSEKWISQPPHKQFRNIAAGGRAPVYNTKLLSPADAPKSWDALKDTKWRGNAFISTSAREIPMGMAFLLGDGKTLEWEKSFAFWREVLDKARPAKVSGFSAPMERLIAGEVALFTIAALQGTMNNIYKGAPLGISPVTGYSAPDSIALVKNAPHPNAARLLIDFFINEGLIDYVNTVQEEAFDPELNKKTKTYLYYQKEGVKMIPLPAGFMTPENNDKSSKFWVEDLYKPAR